MLEKLKEAQKLRHKQASDASIQWKDQHDFLVEYCEINKYNEDQTRHKFDVDWDLNDAMSTGRWSTQEAMRLDSLIRTLISEERLKVEKEILKTQKAILAALESMLPAQNGRLVPQPRVETISDPGNVLEAYRESVMM